MYSTKLRDVPGNFAVESPSLRMTKLAAVPQKNVDPDDAKKLEVSSIVKCINGRQMHNLAWRFDFGGSRCSSFTAALGSRLIVNSAGGILENAGLCLHRNFGFPYIPGSAVKGVARHAAWCDWNEEKDDEKKKAKALAISEVFGCPTNEASLDEFLSKMIGKASRAGKVSFLEAVPTGKAETEVDILNVHHREYYAGERDVALDDENPNLCYFPAVKARTEFLFRVMRLRDLSDEHFGMVVQWLKQGLSVNGIGAKTAAGYGWFDIDLTDYSSIAVDESLLNAWRERYPSATKQKKEFFKSADFLDHRDDPGVMRTVAAFITGQSWWEKEKKNSGSIVTKTINEIAEKFGLEV